MADVVDVQVTVEGRGDRSARIYRQLRDAILDGRLRRGDRLPASRDLAAQLSVSRNTVSAAYDSLAAEGFVVSRVGAGTFVDAGPAAVRGRPGRRSAPAGEVRPTSRWQSLDDGLMTPSAMHAGIRYDFGVGMPDPRLFPWQVWRRLVAAELRPRRGRDRGYADPRGDELLRVAIARHLGMARSVRAASDDVLVTHGAQQALDLVSRVALAPGAVVAMEDPGYPPARRLFRSHGATVVGVPVDAQGIVVDQIPPKASLVYTTPSHQFPLGVAMSLSRRTALLAWAERHRALVVEDDYDSEFRYSDRPLEPLQSLDRSGRVVYVGTFSKTMLPMLRIGFCIAPASLYAALVAARQLSDWHGDPANQRALGHFIEEGLLARHVRKASRVYAERHQALVAACASELSGVLDLVPSVAGLHVAGRAADGVDVPAVVAAARNAGALVENLTRYAAGTAPSAGVALGFGMIEAADVRPGIRALASAVRS